MKRQGTTFKVGFALFFVIVIWALFHMGIIG